MFWEVFNLFEQLHRVKRSGKIGVFQLKDSVQFTDEPFKRKIEDFFLKPKEIFSLSNNS